MVDTITSQHEGEMSTVAQRPLTKIVTLDVTFNVSLQKVQHNTAQWRTPRSGEIRQYLETIYKTSRAWSYRGNFSTTTLTPLVGMRAIPAFTVTLNPGSGRNAYRRSKLQMSADAFNCTNTPPTQERDPYPKGKKPSAVDKKWSLPAANLSGINLLGVVHTSGSRFKSVRGIRMSVSAGMV